MDIVQILMMFDTNQTSSKVIRLSDGKHITSVNVLIPIFVQNTFKVNYALYLHDDQRTTVTELRFAISMD